MSPTNFVPVYKSEIKQPDSSDKIRWSMTRMLTSMICAEEEDRDIKIEVFKSQKSGKHKNMGLASITLAQLREGAREIELKTPRGAQVGVINLIGFAFNKRHTFLEYVFGGCEISLMVAIDFTLSNGSPTEKDSLHYFDLKRNEYLQAIQQVGSILQYYDSDK